MATAFPIASTVTRTIRAANSGKATLQSRRRRAFAPFFSRLPRWRAPELAIRGAANLEPPLRSELFSADQMEQHGRNLAVAHRLAQGHAPDRLLARLADNAAILEQ